ncbi:hypothetical protein [Segniliparus rugosus]|uniref:Uncharacterized protein n=1 Tax=Segniliparus rugosus (strain ATCC BAA-974 / DSM 45345 / CCUG 50838 / CIP 108380 / JCM 13579 / CDC 945) TaxID=679197 RepID=E5XRV3_SEGRC|nr:hypothetical protein [Segniliparus rugosus]EFV12968.1 hypothetical protein HMPREF9336_02225 [Segniliparus rugosus ATCC BAA-974]
MNGQKESAERRSDPKHGPESFLAVVVTALSLMAVAAFGKDGWYPYALLGILILGVGLAVQTKTARRVGMGILAAVVGAVVFRYMYWLFLYTIPGMFISLFSNDPSHMRF